MAGTSPLTTNREVFTLAYLRSHQMVVENSGDNYVDVSCSVVILLPVNEDNQKFTSNNYDLLENNVLMKLDFFGEVFYLLFAMNEIFIFDYFI